MAYKGAFTHDIRNMFEFVDCFCPNFWISATLGDFSTPLCVDVIYVASSRRGHEERRLTHKQGLLFQRRLETTSRSSVSFRVTSHKSTNRGQSQNFILAIPLRLLDNEKKKNSTYTNNIPRLSTLQQQEKEPAEHPSLLARCGRPKHASSRRHSPSRPWTRCPEEIQILHANGTLLCSLAFCLILPFWVEPLIWTDYPTLSPPPISDRLTSTSVSSIETAAAFIAANKKFPCSECRRLPNSRIHRWVKSAHRNLSFLDGPKNQKTITSLHPIQNGLYWPLPHGVCFSGHWASFSGKWNASYRIDQIYKYILFY